MEALKVQCAYIGFFFPICKMNLIKPWSFPSFLRKLDIGPVSEFLIKSSDIYFMGPFIKDVIRTKGEGGYLKSRHCKGGCVILALYIWSKCGQGGEG